MLDCAPIIVRQNSAQRMVLGISDLPETPGVGWSGDLADCVTVIPDGETSRNPTKNSLSATLARSIGEAIVR